MKKTLFAVALALLAMPAVAQKTNPKKEKAPSVERAEAPKANNTAGKQNGPAEIDANITGNYGALHHHLPKGTFVKVRNPKNEKTVMVEIEGKITDRNAMYILKISPAAAAKIDAEGKMFPVELEFDDKGGATIVDNNPEPDNKPITAGAQTHTVKTGDTLSQLAKTYGVTVADIKKANALKSDKIKVGQKLKIPAAKEKKDTGKK
jgi:LysM repeat protein